jgi:hypothetical protein
MAAWPYQRSAFRFAGHVGDDSPGRIIVWVCLLFFVGCGFYILTLHPLGGLLILGPAVFAVGTVLVAGAREGLVDAVICTADGLNVTRRFLFRRRAQTDIYRWPTITNVRVVAHSLGEGRKLAYLEVDTSRQPKVLEVRTTLIDFDQLLDVIAVMTPQLPYRWERGNPNWAGPTTSYDQVERPRSDGRFGQAA